MALVFTTEAQVFAIVNGIFSGQLGSVNGVVPLDSNGQINPVYLATALATGNGGSVNPSSTPPSDSVTRTFYPDSEGDYANFPAIGGGNLAVDYEEDIGLILFIGNDSDGFEKVVSPVPLDQKADKSETDPAIRKIDGVVTSSVNLIDPLQVIEGWTFSYGVGNSQVNASYLCIIIPVKPNTTYSYVGFNLLFAGNEYDALVNPNSISSFIAERRTQSIGDNSELKQTIQFTTHADTAYVGLNISNSLDYGRLDTVMLYEGILGSLPYQPFFNPVDPLKIKGGVPNLAAFSMVEKDQEALLSQFDITSHYKFNGTATAILPVNYVLENIGDYIEFVGRDTKLPGDQNQASLRLFGNGGNQNTFGYYASNQIWFRGDSGDYIEFTVPSGVIFGQWNKIRVEINASDEWELIINDVSIATEARTTTFVMRRIADAGTPTAKADLINLRIKGTVGEIEIVDFTLIENTGVLFVPEARFKGLVVPSDTFSPCYLSYLQDSGSGQPAFYAFVQLSNSNYVRYVIENVFDMSDAVYVDMFRITSAQLYEFDGSTMYPTGINILTTGESESVFKERGKEDFSGGFHGDETKEWVKFYINNVEFPADEDLDLVPCLSFKYVQFSHVHETAPDNETHEVIAHHYKETVFMDGGYSTKNRYIFQREIDIETLYLGLVTISHAQADYAVNEDYVSRTMNRLSGNGETQYLGIEGAKKMDYNAPSTGLSATCYAEILDNPAWDADSTAFTKDNASYAKYYRGTKDKIVQDGDRITGFCRVKHYIKE